MGSSIYSTAVPFVFTAITGPSIQQSNYYSRYSCAIIANRVNTNPIDTIIFSILILFSFRWIFNPISFLFFFYFLWKSLIFILRLETCYVHNILLFLCMPNHPFVLVTLSETHFTQHLCSLFDLLSSLRRFQLFHREHALHQYFSIQVEHITLSMKLNKCGSIFSTCWKIRSGLQFRFCAHSLWLVPSMPIFRPKRLTSKNTKKIHTLMLNSVA